MDDQSQNPLLSQIDSDEQKRQALQQAILAKIQTAQADTTDVDAARDKAGRDQMISGIGRAVEGFSRANAQSRGGSAVDPTLYNNIDARAHQDVKDAIAARQQKVAFALEQAKQQNEAIKEGRDVTKLKIDATNKINEDSHRKAQDDIATQQLGVNQDNSAETNRHNQASEANGLQIHQDNLADRQQRTQDSQDAKTAAATTKTTENQDKAYADYGSKIASSRQSPEVRQALLDTYNAKKALDITKGKDFLTTQDLHGFTMELGKIAMSGVPTDHGMSSLMPNNLQTKFSELQNFITSKPTDAQSNEYFQRNKQYLENMVNSADSTIREGHAKLLRYYAPKIGPEHTKHELENQNLDENFNLKPLTDASNSPASPDDQAAMEWLKANPNDPRAPGVAKTLKSKGL